MTTSARLAASSKRCAACLSTMMELHARSAEMPVSVSRPVRRRLGLVAVIRQRTQALMGSDIAVTALAAEVPYQQRTTARLASSACRAHLLSRLDVSLI